MLNRNYPEYGEYKIPKKNVLVVSCMDLRLTDDLVNFLHHDNLQNRYDHFILAGASLCSCHPKSEDGFKEEVLKRFKNFKGWTESLEEHIELAIELHHIEDIYIVEHMDCGAYKEFLTDGKTEEHAKEEAMHLKFSTKLSEKIKTRHADLNVHSFLINLRGDVKLLFSKSA